MDLQAIFRRRLNNTVSRKYMSSTTPHVDNTTKNPIQNAASLPVDIRLTLERSKEIRDAGIVGDRYGLLTSEHFHSFEYLVSLIAKRQDESNKSLDRLTKSLVALTVVLLILTAFLCQDAYFERQRGDGPKHSPSQKAEANVEN